MSTEPGTDKKPRAKPSSTSAGSAESEQMPPWLFVCMVILACLSTTFGVLIVLMLYTGMDPTTSQSVSLGQTTTASSGTSSADAIPTDTLGSPTDAASADTGDMGLEVEVYDSTAPATWVRESAPPPAALLALPPELADLVAGRDLDARDPPDVVFSLNALTPNEPLSQGAQGVRTNAARDGADEEANDEGTARAIETSLAPAAARLGVPAPSVVASVQSDEEGLFDCTFSARSPGAASANVLRGSGASPQASCAAALGSAVVRDDEPISDDGLQQIGS